MGNLRKIAIQGVKGAFHEEAAIKVFGKNIEIVPCITFKELAEKVASREVDNALMAIENTISGTILANLELIRNYKLSIIGETYLRIRQNLGVIKGTKLEEVKEVYSHYMALNQCREFFNPYPGIKLIESADTALSLKEVAEHGRKELAAIGSKLAIEYYGLEMLAESIETDKQNYTRFAVIGTEQNRSDDCSKISLTMVLPHEAGSLSKVLSLLHLLNINLTKIESVPVIGKPFQYRFYLDLILSTAISYQTAMEAMQPLTQELTILGRYIPALSEEV